jgi:hypothetical protein
MANNVLSWRNVGMIISHSESGGESEASRAKTCACLGTFDQSNEFTFFLTEFE